MEKKRCNTDEVYNKALKEMYRIVPDTKISMEPKIFTFFHRLVTRRKVRAI